MGDNMIRQKVKGRLTGASRLVGCAELIPRILLLGVFSLLLAACPPQPPTCEDPVEEEAVKAVFGANSVVQQVTNALQVRSIDVGTCFVDGRVQVIYQVELPRAYSEFGIIYTDRLDFTYARDGSLEISGYGSRPTALDANVILEFFRNRVAQFESFPRVREVIINTEPDLGNPTMPLGFVYRLNNHLGYAVRDADDYNEATDYVTEYQLANDIKWQEFPELGRAHDLIEEQLLVGEYSNCSIGQDPLRSYTMVQFHDSATDAWLISVSVVCGDDWKSAFVKLNPDGTYERLHMEAP